MKTSKIEALCTAEVKARIHKRALEFGMSDSEFLIFCAINSVIKINIGSTGTEAVSEMDSAVRWFEKKLIQPHEFSQIKQAIFKELEK
jgi:hypothetical protein